MFHFENNNRKLNCEVILKQANMVCNYPFDPKIAVVLVDFSKKLLTS